jgi:S1-C subfamily serine protease
MTGQLGVPVIADSQEAIVGFNQPRLKAMAARHARPKLGLMVGNAEGGAKVGGVRPDTVGQRAGVEVGDVVVEMSGLPVGNADELEKAAARMRFGQPTSMQVLRNGERKTLILRP